MKKLWITMLSLALLLALCASALAEGYTCYVNANNVKVYKKADKKSKVVTKVNGNDKVTVVDEIGGWSQISIKVKGKKKTGWVQNKYLSDDPVPSKCKHNWGSWEVREPATCTHKGWRVRYCKKCGIMDEGEIKKAPHEYGKWKVTKKATCTKKGEKERKCKVCGHVETKEIAKAEHEYGNWKVVKEATCTEKGERTRKCKVCGHKQSEEFLEPHEYGKWEVTKEATCTEKGEKVRTCKVCGKEEKKAIDVLPHDYEWKIIVEATDHSSGTRARVCKRCGLTEQEESYDPEGTIRRGAKGDDVKAMQQLLVDQKYLNAGGADGVFGGGTEKAVMQFQMDQGLNPDGVAWPQTLKRLAHNFGPWVIVKPLTRTEAGERVRTCVDCGYEQRQTIEMAPYFERKARGEAVRALQQILSECGYDVGGFDGIYGQKLDNAFAAFAEANGLSFQAGSVLPADVDALMNHWIAEVPEAQWMGEGTESSPVNLALTVTPEIEGDADDDIRTFNWTLTNLGSEKCMFTALLVSYGAETDFVGDDLTLVIDGLELKPNCANSASGSFTVSADWGEGNLNFAALAISESNGAKWLSNAVAFEKETAPEVKTVVPMLPQVDVNALEDGVYPVSFDRGDVFSGASGVYMNSVHVYTEEVFDIVDISTLQPGDSIVVEGETIPVESVEQGENVLINGGLDAGGIELTTREDTNGYFVDGYDDLSTYSELGVTTLTLSPSAVYTDSSDIEGEPVTATGDAIVEAIQSSDNDYFDQSNTTVTIEDGQVVQIDRVYVP